MKWLALASLLMAGAAAARGPVPPRLSYHVGIDFDSIGHMSKERSARVAWFSAHPGYESARLIEHPTLVDMWHAYPTGHAGRFAARLDCRLGADGTLRACKIGSMVPEDEAFDGTALRLAAKIRVDRDAIVERFLPITGVSLHLWAEDGTAPDNGFCPISFCVIEYGPPPPPPSLPQP